MKARRLLHGRTLLSHVTWKVDADGTQVWVRVNTRGCKPMTNATRAAIEAITRAVHRESHLARESQRPPAWLAKGAL